MTALEQITEQRFISLLKENVESFMVTGPHSFDKYWDFVYTLVHWRKMPYIIDFYSPEKEIYLEHRISGNEVTIKIKGMLI